MNKKRRFRQPWKWFTPLLIVGTLAGCSSSEPVCESSPCEPQTALSTFEIVEGFQIELFTAEPMLRDPVAMEVDEMGRIYVVEDPGYPEELEGHGKVRLLEDTTEDGYPDSSSLFADGLRAPRGVMRWKDGILVTDAPHIYYMEDTTGDGRADLKEIILTGFDYGNPQLGVNTPIYGLDNWIYVAHVYGSSQPEFTDHPETRSRAGRGNIRFRPDSYQWESTSAGSQFGHSFDAFGRPLHTHNNDHISQEVIAARYLERNPDLLVAQASVSIAEHGGGAEVYPITKETRHELFTDKGTFTAACGITCYLGGSFPAEFQGVSFVAEPAHNLVHADRLSEEGTRLVASRLLEEREFLASTDRWFRPVNFYIGPDGALYVIDYYREVIEQPRFLSEEVLESDILYDGTERGRIYRITAKGSNSPQWLSQLDLKNADSQELVNHLKNDNIWWRRNAQRLLVDRQDSAVLPLLEQLATNASTPETRVHALWTLKGLDALEPSLLESALQDSSPRVREHAVQLTEFYLGTVENIASLLLDMADESDAGVRFQLVATLGNLGTPESKALREQMLYKHIEDEWMQLAALSAGDIDYRSLFEKALANLSGHLTDARKVFFERIGMLIGARRQTGEVSYLVNTITSTTEKDGIWWQAASLSGLADGIQSGRHTSQTLQFIQQPMATLSLHPLSSTLRTAAREVLEVVGPPSDSTGEEVFTRAVEIARDDSRDPDFRVDAIKLLNLSNSSLYIDLLEQLLSQQEPVSLQAAAARALGQIEGSQIGEMLLSRWNRMTPQVRNAAIESMVSDDARINLLLDAIKEGEVQRSALTIRQTRRLMLNPEDDLRLRARSLLGKPDEPRSEVVDRFAAAIGMEGDPVRGQAVFERACAMCHQIGGTDGTHFGPDLSSVRNRNPKGMLASILMPNAEITAGYEQWKIERHSGEVIHGIISSETSGAVTLRGPSGQETTISRSDIKSMEAVEESAMPEGIEHQISIKEMADLLEYIRNP